MRKDLVPANGHGSQHVEIGTSEWCALTPWMSWLVSFLQRICLLSQLKYNLTLWQPLSPWPLCSPQAGKRLSNPAFWWIDGNGEELRWSFEELGLLSRKFANILTEACSLQRGDRVMVILPKIPEWWLANVACLRTGNYVTLLTTFQQARFIHCLQTCSKGLRCILKGFSYLPTIPFHVSTISLPDSIRTNVFC